VAAITALRSSALCWASESSLWVPVTAMDVPSHAVIILWMHLAVETMQ
jgi:hypothetical protein